jgi:glycosyltransferase involved in cell wall biosynthesis
MNKKRIVFLLNSVQIQRVVKRINSFFDAGYEIEVYGFDRIGVSPCGLKAHFSYKIIGEFPNKMPYLRRISFMRKHIKEIETEIKMKNCILYIFGLDMALVARTVLKMPYIYEEADLVHTYMPNSVVRKFLEWKDVKIIKKSLLTVLTSEGFVEYHFGNHPPSNIMVISNKLNPAILELPQIRKESLNEEHLKVGFVGSFRFNSVVNFCKVFVENFPQHELHVYGTMPENSPGRKLLNFKNFFFHGPFKNPDDLPQIYSNIDLSLSTYDAYTVNAQFAEPNKMYEAMYFETPIIVSKGTFLEHKVEQLGMGYAIDSMNDKEVINFVSSLKKENIMNCVKNLKTIDKTSAVYQTGELFQRVDSILL